MSFSGTNQAFAIALLMGLTLFMAGVRMRKPLENNWPLLYWILMTVISFRYPDDTYDPRIIMIGLAAGLMLRFEFINRAFATAVRFVEACVWAYILYTGFLLITL